MKQTKQKIKACLALLLTAGMLLNRQVSAGAIQNQIDRTGQKINDLKDAVDETDKNISVWQIQQQALEQEIAYRQDKISRLSAELDQTKADMSHTQAEIKKTQKALEASIKDSEQQYEQMKQRICLMYENSTMDILMYVLDAASFSEAQRRMDYFQAVMAYDRQKMEEYKAVTRTIKKEKSKLVSKKAKLDSLKATQTEQLGKIDNAVADLKKKLGDKISKIQASAALKEQYEQELERQKQYEKELERQKAEEDQKREEEIRKQEEELKRIREEEQKQRRREEEERQRKQQEQKQDSGQQGGGSGSGASGGSTGSSYAAGAGDLELLSTIIYCEAGNQSYEGQLAVGSVILNRVESSSFPNSISGVIYQSGQFSPVASGRFAHALAAGLGSQCLSAAQAVLNGSRNVDCLYFRVDNGLIDGTVIGNHVFY